MPKTAPSSLGDGGGDLMVSLFAPLFRSMHDFVYRPITNWAHALSPTLYFGCNVEQEPVERHVVSKVGSYGLQLNRILDVLTVLVARIEEPLTAQERKFVDAFETLAEKADEEARSFQGRGPRGVTKHQVDQLIQELRRLRRSREDGERELYRYFVDQLSTALPPHAGSDDAAPGSHGQGSHPRR